MLEHILTAEAAGLGIALPDTAPAAFRAYYTLLAERNAVMDLTAVTGEEQVARRHFLDSLMLTHCADLAGKRVIDVGTGAGFPGLPLKIAVPSMELTLLDAQQKRVDFLQEACAASGVQARCIHARAEEAAAELREQFDAAVSRAVARLNILCELCLPFVRPGGLFLAMKGSAAQEEADEARSAAAVLGGKIVRLETYTLPGEDIRRAVVVIRKERATPPQYPRRFARIQKKPL